MRKLLMSLLVVLPGLIIYSTYGCASPTPASYQDAPTVRVDASIQLAQGYGGYGGRKLKRQVCTAINKNTGYRYIGKNPPYDDVGINSPGPREMACAGAIHRCLEHNPSAPCECIPEKKDRGGSCEEVDWPL